MKKLNKKGFVYWIPVLIVAGVVILFILLSKGVFGNFEATSQTDRASGYDKDKCPSHLVIVSGNVNIEDSGGLTLNPSIKEVKDIEVTSKKLCFFCSQAPFSYEVTAIDDPTNRKLGRVFEGSGELKDSDNNGIDKPFSISYSIPDENCDGWFDDHAIRLQVRLKGDDVGDRAEYEKLVRFRGGKVLT